MHEVTLPRGVAGQVLDGAEQRTGHVAELLVPGSRGVEAVRVAAVVYAGIEGVEQAVVRSHVENAVALREAVREALVAVLQE